MVVSVRNNVTSREIVEEHGESFQVETWDDGVVFWRQRGALHRVHGPAIEYADGSNFWYQNGKRHRDDGPAFDGKDGTKEFYYHGVDITNEINDLGYQNAEPEFLRTMIPLIAAGKSA